MKAMYELICDISSISKEQYPLKYSRIESGSMLISLVGNVAVLGSLGSILTFTYKIYSEQFSPKAKQELKLGDIKVRREYLKYLKEKKDLEFEITQDGLQEKLAQLEDTNIELFKNNPYIDLNGKKIGVAQMGNSKITDINFLKGEYDLIDTEDNNSKN
jgi:hypothetical protein